MRSLPGAFLGREAAHIPRRWLPFPPSMRNLVWQFKAFRLLAKRLPVANGQTVIEVAPILLGDFRF